MPLTNISSYIYLLKRIRRRVLKLHVP